jgi:hypothetical protein
MESKLLQSWERDKERVVSLGRLDDAYEHGFRAGESTLRAENEALREALSAMTEKYCQLAGSGDAGFWNPEEEPEVIQARAALKAHEGRK